jgi:hypothetical protein
MTMSAAEKTAPEETQSRVEFQKAPEEVRELIKAVLQEERDVMHMRTRPEIHKNILQHVKRLVQ